MALRKLFALLLVACSSTSTAATETPDAKNPPRDSVSSTDPTPVDDDTDAGTKPKSDAGKDASPDAGVDDLLGTLSDGCGALVTELGSDSPSLINDSLVFTAGETFTKASLSSGGQTLFDVPNAGGSSFESETMSFEVLHACSGASLLKTETEVTYDTATPGPITDILVEINGQKVGVSVTRAYKPSNLTYSDADVQALLQKKLTDIKASSARVLPADKWVKQVLHVFTANQATTDAVARVVPNLDAATRADTIILVTRTTGGGFIYCNPDPPLGSECP